MDMQQARVILIDDQAVMRIFLLGGLRRIGITDLHAFADARQALEAVPQLQPDLILTDVHMQPLGGIALVQALRAMPDARARATRVIFITGDDTAATLQAAQALGVLACLHKPATPAALAAAVTAALAAC